MTKRLNQLLLIATTCTAVAAHADEASGPSDGLPAMQPELVVGDSLRTEAEAPLSDLAARIEAFEHEQVKLILDAQITQIERATHRYHEDLLEPLTLLGDAQMKAEEYDKALESYGRAVHIDRVNNGLHSPKQIDTVYKQAAAWQAVGNLTEANNRHEYAYEVQQRMFSPNNLKLLKPLYRLADWYTENSNILPARTLYIRALGILQANEMGEHPEAIRPLRAIATTYRRQRFPSRYVRPETSESAGFSYNQTERVYSPSVAPGAATITQFPRGEKALNQVVKILQADPDTPPAELAEAFVDLADWNLLFGYPSRSTPLYTHAQGLYAEDPDSEGIDFSTPQLIYFPAPPPLKREPGKDPQEGYVTVSFTVSDDGEVRQLTTVAAEPDNRMVFRLRRSMRVSRFRPAFADGVPVPVEGQTFTHRYIYFGDPPGEEEESGEPDAVDTEAVETEVDETAPEEAEPEETEVEETDAPASEAGDA